MRGANSVRGESPNWSGLKLKGARLGHVWECWNLPCKGIGTKRTPMVCANVHGLFPCAGLLKGRGAPAMVRIRTNVSWVFAENAKLTEASHEPPKANKPKGRIGRHERKALEAAKAADKAKINQNLSSPLPVETWSKADRRGNIVMGYQSTTSRNNLLTGTHTMGFHSSSIRGHKAGGTAHSQRWARDGFKD